MRNSVAAAIAITLVTCATVSAQRPSDPALLVPQTAPVLNYVAVTDVLVIPSGVPTGAYASVAFDAKGHFYALNRGPKPLMKSGRAARFASSASSPTRTTAASRRTNTTCGMEGSSSRRSPSWSSGALTRWRRTSIMTGASRPARTARRTTSCSGASVMPADPGAGTGNRRWTPAIPVGPSGSAR